MRISLLFHFLPQNIFIIIFICYIVPLIIACGLKTYVKSNDKLVRMVHTFYIPSLEAFVLLQLTTFFLSEFVKAFFNDDDKPIFF